MLNSGSRTILIKSVRTFVAVVWGAMKPLENIKHTKMYGCYLIGLPTGDEEKEEKKEREQERYERKSWSPAAPAANCTHCNLISTSKRIDTGSAISNRLFDMPKPRESCMWVLKNR